MLRYILDENGDVKATENLLEWARFIESGVSRRVDITSIEYRMGGNDRIFTMSISTVFLGLDHNFGPEGPPALWESMIFCSDVPALDNSMERCSGTKDDARKMHARLTGRALISMDSLYNMQFVRFVGHKDEESLPIAKALPFIDHNEREERKMG